MPEDAHGVIFLAPLASLKHHCHCHTLKYMLWTQCISIVTFSLVSRKDRSENVLIISFSLAPSSLTCFSHHISWKTEKNQSCFSFILGHLGGGGAGQGVSIEQGLSPWSCYSGRSQHVPPKGVFRRAQYNSVSPRLGAPPLLHTPAGMTHSSPVAGEPRGQKTEHKKVISLNYIKIKLNYCLHGQMVTLYFTVH